MAKKIIDASTMTVETIKVGIRVTKPVCRYSTNIQPKSPAPTAKSQAEIKPKNIIGR